MPHATQTTLRSFVSTLLLLLCIGLTHNSVLAAEKGGGHEPVVEALNSLLDERPDLRQSLQAALAQADLDSVRSMQEFYVYLDELVELFRYCQDGVKKEHRTKFIWCHAGISRRIVVDDLPFWLGEVLEEFPDQVYIDISWVVLEDYIYKDMKPWVALISKYPDSFMIGSDVVGGTSRMGSELGRYDKLLAALKPGLRDKLARTNFIKLMDNLAKRRQKAGLGRGGLVLPQVYEFPEYAHTKRPSDRNSFIRSRRSR